MSAFSPPGFSLSNQSSITEIPSLGWSSVGQGSPLVESELFDLSRPSSDQKYRPTPGLSSTKEFLPQLPIGSQRGEGHFSANRTLAATDVPTSASERKSNFSYHAKQSQSHPRFTKEKKSGFHGNGAHWKPESGLKAPSNHFQHNRKALQDSNLPILLPAHRKVIAREERGFIIQDEQEDGEVV